MKRRWEYARHCVVGFRILASICMKPMTKESVAVTNTREERIEFHSVVRRGEREVARMTLKEDHRPEHKNRKQSINQCKTLQSPILQNNGIPNSCEDAKKTRCHVSAERYAPMRRSSLETLDSFGVSRGSYESSVVRKASVERRYQDE